MMNTVTIYFHFLILIVSLFPRSLYASLKRENYVKQSFKYLWENVATLMKHHSSSLEDECESASLLFGTHLVDTFNKGFAKNITHRIESWDLSHALGFDYTKPSHDRCGLLPRNRKVGLNDRDDYGSNEEPFSCHYYHILQNKWIYIIGDSTMRQLWGAFSKPLHCGELRMFKIPLYPLIYHAMVSGDGHFAENAVHYARTQCPRQGDRRKTYQGTTGCALNEVTCTIPGFGEDGILSYDWKHFIYEDYDRWLWGGTGPWGLNPHARRPDVVLLETGLHSCSHALDGDKVPEAEILTALDQVEELMQAVKKAMSRPFFHNETIERSAESVSEAATYSLLQPPMVIFVLAGMEFRYSSIDDCIARVNSRVAEKAREFGFSVFQRNELEARLLRKWQYHNQGEVPVPRAIHLDEPAPRIMATSLLGQILCLHDRGHSSMSAQEEQDNHEIPSDQQHHHPHARIHASGIDRNENSSHHVVGLRVAADSNHTALRLSALRNYSLFESVVQLPGPAEQSLERTFFYVDTQGMRRPLNVSIPYHASLREKSMLSSTNSLLVELLTTEDVQGIPLGPVLPDLSENALVRPQGDRQMFVVIAGVFRPIPSMQVLTAHGLDLGDQIIISDKDLRLLPIGETLAT